MTTLTNHNFRYTTKRRIKSFVTRSDSYMRDMSEPGELLLNSEENRVLVETDQTDIILIT
jgi:hypothetical protein